MLALFLLFLCLPLLVVSVLLIFVRDWEFPLHTGERLSKDGKPFFMVKLRTMSKAKEKDQLYTRDTDARITPIGLWLRRLKVDELPQLWNVALGHMNFFGPRPDVPQAFGAFTESDRKILSVLPGLLDLASLVFAKEGKILSHLGKNSHKTVFCFKRTLTCFYVDRSSAQMNFLLLLLLFVRFFSDRFFISGLEKFLNFLSMPRNLREEALFYARI